MYETFFGLQRRPFDLTSDPRFVVLTEAHREALDTLDYGMGSRKGLMVLVGEAGSGKTTVIRAAIDRQSTTVHSVHLGNPTLSRQEFVEMLAARFGLSAAARASKATLLLELEALLRQRAVAGETTVLIVDEAQSLPMELLEEVRLLANIETDDEKLLQVVLAGQPELDEMLDTRDLRQLKQRVALRAEIGRLSEADTAVCISGRLRKAGGVPAEIFTREAVALLHERSGGLPRVICAIADNALLAGFAHARKPVTRSLVEDASNSLAIRPSVAVPEQASAAFASLAMPEIEATAQEPQTSQASRVAPTTTASSLAQEARSSAAETSSAEGTAAGGPRSDLFGTFGAKRRRFALFGN